MPQCVTTYVLHNGNSGSYKRIGNESNNEKGTNEVILLYSPYSLRIKFNEYNSDKLERYRVLSSDQE
jgi:hypothetical protein